MYQYIPIQDLPAPLHMVFHWAALLLFRAGSTSVQIPSSFFREGGGRKSPDINYIQTQTYSAASLHLYIYILFIVSFSILRYGIWLHFLHFHLFTIVNQLFSQCKLNFCTCTSTALLHGCTVCTVKCNSVQSAALSYSVDLLLFTHHQCKSATASRLSNKHT